MIDKISQDLNSNFHYIDDVMSLINSRFGEYLHHIYQNELEIKDIPDTQRYVSYLVRHVEIHNGGRLKRKLYDTRK
jgi:hypothetical protein